MPWPAPYWRLRWPCRATSSSAMVPRSAKGRSSSQGLPPAREMTPGVMARSKTSRTADCFTPRARSERNAEGPAMGPRLTTVRAAAEGMAAGRSRTSPCWVSSGSTPQQFGSVQISPECR
ncbi:hypothetical protein ACFFX0_19815 [Citricoccus parietis]|uniref:Uncharacterized protein n=1 Tax=Citricoccus parietis TaxID=592307 RepID=A0ABV5G309_9MICC